MKQSYIFISGIIAITLVTTLIIIGLVQLSSSQPTQKVTSDSTQNKYKAFSNPTNVFESLRRNTKTSSRAFVENEGVDSQSTIIQNILRSWEEGVVTSDTAVINPNISAAEQESITQLNSSQQTEREEITALFKSLIGAKTINYSAQTSYTNLLNTNSIWLGGYSNTQTVVQKEVQTKDQIALRAYGNKLGSLLTSFNISNGNQTDLLDTFLKNRNNTKSLELLTDNYTKLSKDIGKILTPAQLETIHPSLVSSYASVGTLLWELTLAENDQELLSKMLIYNKASEAVAKNHVALITLFKAYGIVFKSYEGGSIFSFNPSVGGSL